MRTNRFEEAENQRPAKRKKTTPDNITPNAAMLYQQLCAKKTYRLMSKNNPEALKLKLANQNGFSILKASLAIEDYWDYTLIVTPENEALITELDTLRCEPFQALGYIPLKELSFTFAGFLFCSDKTQEQEPDALGLNALPIDYRAELVYAFLVKALFQETQASKKSDWLFSGRLLLNKDTIALSSEDPNEAFLSWNLFLDRTRTMIGSNDYTFYLEVRARFQALIEENQYPFSPLPSAFCFLNLVPQCHQKPHFTIPRQLSDLLSKDTRSFFSNVQYRYLQEVNKLIATLSPTFTYTEEELPLSFFKTSEEKAQASVTCSSINLEYFPENKLFNQLIQCIEQTISIKPSTLINPLKSFGTFGFNEDEGIDQYKKIKLCWQRNEKGLYFIPLLLNRKEDLPTGASDLFTLGFTRELSVAIEKILRPFFAQAPGNPISRCRPNTEIASNYMIHINNEGIEYLLNNAHLVYADLSGDKVFKNSDHANNLSFSI